MKHKVRSLREAVDIYYFLKEDKKPKFKVGDRVVCSDFIFPLGVVVEVLEPDIENYIYEYRYMVKVDEKMSPVYFYEDKMKPYKESDFYDTKN